MKVNLSYEQIIALLEMAEESQLFNKNEDLNQAVTELQEARDRIEDENDSHYNPCEDMDGDHVSALASVYGDEDETPMGIELGDGFDDN